MVCYSNTLLDKQFNEIQWSVTCDQRVKHTNLTYVLSGGLIECLDEPWHVGVCAAGSLTTMQPQCNHTAVHPTVGHHNFRWYRPFIINGLKRLASLISEKRNDCYSKTQSLLFIRCKIGFALLRSAI